MTSVFLPAPDYYIFWVLKRLWFWIRHTHKRQHEISTTYSSSALWKHQMCKLKTATNSLMSFPSSGWALWLFWLIEYMGSCAVPVSGSGPLENGSLHFTFPGTLTLGCQPPPCEEARAASWRGLAWLSTQTTVNSNLLFHVRSLFNT